MMRIAFGLVHFGLCLGMYHAFSSAMQSTQNIHTSPKICISAEIVWLHYHDL